MGCNYQPIDISDKGCKFFAKYLLDKLDTWDITSKVLAGEQARIRMGFSIVDR